MNSRGSWEGISNASPAGSSCCVYDLLCKTDFSLRMLISSWLSSLCEAITLPKPQAPNPFSFNTAQHTSKNTAPLSGWTTDYRSETEATMITAHVHLRRGAFSYVTSMTPLNHLPAVPDRCRELGFSGSSAGVLDRISRPLIPHTVPCRPRRRLPFVSNPLLTSTSYCHLVSWGSCHGEQNHPSLATIPSTHFTSINNTDNLFPEDVCIASAQHLKSIWTWQINSTRGSLCDQLGNWGLPQLFWL